MIPRDISNKLKKLALGWPSITLTGPRQSGKTTLIRHHFPHLPYIDFDIQRNAQLATEDALLYLATFPNGAIFDEIQQVPSLFSALRVSIDEDPTPGKWILSGSYNFALLASISQSLAGRTALLVLFPLSLQEITRSQKPHKSLDEVLFRGSFPRLIDNDNIDPNDWHDNYTNTYLEKDIRPLRSVDSISLFRKFLRRCAVSTGKVLNYSSLARDLEISQSTVKAWLGLLETSYIVFLLPVVQLNPRKELAKIPKLYFSDTGLVCHLLDIESSSQLAKHPLRGFLFETWVVSEVAKAHASAGRRGKMWYYRDKYGLEADLILKKSHKDLSLVEVKSSLTPSLSMIKNVLKVEQKLKEHFSCSTIVIYGGHEQTTLHNCKILPWHHIHHIHWNEIA